MNFGTSASDMYADLDGVDLTKEATAQAKLRQYGLTQRLRVANRAYADGGAAARQQAEQRRLLEAIEAKRALQAKRAATRAIDARR